MKKRKRKLRARPAVLGAWGVRMTLRNIHEQMN
jgi:hypothetical protein